MSSLAIDRGALGAPVRDVREVQEAHRRGDVEREHELPVDGRRGAAAVQQVVQRARHQLGEQEHRRVRLAHAEQAEHARVPQPREHAHLLVHEVPPLLGREHLHADLLRGDGQIGRASCRERV